MSGAAPILKLAGRSVWNRKLTAILTILAVALSVTLYMGVEKIRHGTRASFERTISGADLIVGARSGPVNLLLYSVFHIGNATNNITWDSYQRIAGRPKVDWTIPISMGDSHRGFRVLGTTQSFFDHYQYGDAQPVRLAKGEAFGGVYDAVLGAAAARALGYGLGEEIVLSHGLGEVSFSDHEATPFTVTGILAPTGTPVDRAVLVSLQGVEAMHAGWENGAPTPMARYGTAESMAAEARAAPPEAITAFYLGMASKTAVLQLQRDINTYEGEALQAAIPGVALTQLWDVVGVVERALASISGFVIFVGLLTILTSILTSLNERRREMAVLRSLGARPWHIFALLVSEAALLAFLGAALALALLYGALFALAPAITARYGVALTDIGPGWLDVKVVVAVTLAAALLGMIPAWRAFRNSLADGLTIRV